jgi:hypothetical protein
MTIRFNKWCRSITLRATLIFVTLALRLATLICLCVQSIDEKSRNGFLIFEILAHVVGLFLLGVSSFYWIESWPDETGVFEPVSYHCKCFYLLSLFLATGLFALSAMNIFDANSKTNLLDSVLIMQIPAILFVQIIGVDVYADRRTNNFVFDTLTLKITEKFSDAEPEYGMVQLTEIN